MSRKKNVVTEIARREGRDYITPEDVGMALKIYPVDKVRLDTLHVLANVAGFGYEDGGCCAFVAWKGETEEEAT